MTDEEDVNLEEFLFLGAASPPEPSPKEPEVATKSVEVPVDNDADVDAAGFLASLGLKQQTRDTGSKATVKPWMKFHHFTLVRTIDEVRAIVDAALEHGRCALDLECQGFDNRIERDADGKLYTVHKIVGYCLSVKARGYYIPVHHTFKPKYNEVDPNVPTHLVEAEIKRLCEAAQPRLTPEGQAEDPLGSPKIETPPRVVIYFWNAKFDQEFLYPVTGIDYWHPASFEDGMLAAYTYYTDDDLGLKNNAATRLKINEGGSSIPYEMVKFEDLFPPGMRAGNRKIAELYPEDDALIVYYGCSDAICTELLCETGKVDWDFKIHPEGTEFRPSLADVGGIGQGVYKLEKQVGQVVRVMERYRVKIDQEAVRALLAEAEQESNQYHDRITALAKQKGFAADFNPGSTAQLSEFLFEKHGLNLRIKPAKNEASNQYKTDADTLSKIHQQLDVDVLDWVIKLRQVDKIKGTYLVSMLQDVDQQGCLRFNLNQTGAATGRFTAPAKEKKGDHGYSRVPIHGIPARDDPKKPKVAQSLRSAFVAREGYAMVKIDYSGQELRIVANVSGEPVWTKEFLEGSGDLHTITAKAFFGPHITKENKLERGMGKCAHPDTLVFSGGRYCTMASLGGVLDAEAETFLPVTGVTVYNTREEAPVKALYNGGSKQLLHVVTTGGLLTCTERHRFKLRDGSLISAANLKPDDLLESVSLPQIGNNPYPEVTVSLWPGIPAASYRVNHDWAYFAGSTVTESRIPWWVLQSGREAFLHYLGGLIDTDGTVDKKNRNLSICTKDYVFAGQLATMMRACGLDFNVALSYNKTYDRYYVELDFTVASSWEMRHYFKHTGKKSYLRASIHTSSKSDRFIVRRVLQGPVAPCCDLQLQTPDHLYVANGLLTHNTANFALIYGGGVQAIQRATKCDQVEASRRKANFDKSVPIFANWVKKQHARVKRDLGVHNAFGRFLRIPDAAVRAGSIIGQKTLDEKEARKIRASCERKSTNFPIQSSGADILKISLVKLQKEFFGRGWLSDDSVRMLLTVHDEIVFEIKLGRLAEAVPVISDVMIYPSTMARWVVPLEVEVLVDSTWKARYEWSDLVQGKKPVPDFLQGYVPTIGAPTPLKVLPAALPPEPIERPVSVGQENAVDSPEEPLPIPSPDPKPVALKGVQTPERAFTLALFTLPHVYLTRESVRILLMAVWGAVPLEGEEPGIALKVVDENGNVLVRPELGLRVIPSRFARELKDRNLGGGQFQME